MAFAAHATMGKRFNTGVQIALVSIACLASITLATRRTRHVVDALLADSRRMLHLGAQRVHVGGMPVKMTSHAHSVQLAKFPCTQAWLLVTTAHVDWWLQQMEAEQAKTMEDEKLDYVSGKTRQG